MAQNPDPQQIPTDGWPDDLPPCLIHVDKEGRLWHLGAEMIHKGINQLLMEHVELDEKGRYIIVFRGQRCFVEVEDTLFVINRVDHLPEAGKEPEKFVVTLNDDSREELHPETLFLGDENVLYARIKSRRFPARFLRKGYYQLADHIIEKEGRFILPYRGREYEIA